MSKMTMEQVRTTSLTPQPPRHGAAGGLRAPRLATPSAPTDQTLARVAPVLPQMEQEILNLHSILETRGINAKRTADVSDAPRCPENASQRTEPVTTRPALRPLT